MMVIVLLNLTIQSKPNTYIIAPKNIDTCAEEDCGKHNFRIYPKFSPFPILGPFER